jgi:long-chain acyl-CoA synthetase
MLSHANIMSQLRNFHTLIDVHAGDTTLSLLPPWHIYERTTGYFIFQQGTTQVC